ncbi:MAG: CDP-alcohol phosphatidyltransferase family protein [Bacteroidales bacterium]|jgi:phosphatidylglycerophosphate synthase
MKKDNNSLDKILKIIAKDRERTNIMRKSEQKAIAYLVQHIPSFINSNNLTGIGLFGNLIVVLGFILGAFINTNYLLLGIVGCAINWFGDSLDGRLAYYRGKPRKWYGFCLDITIDWIGIISIGVGFILYLEPQWRLIGYIFIVMYGGEMITTLLRYKITNNYSIDSGILGPTEVRIIISIVLIIETIFTGSILYFAIGASAILLISNIRDVRLLLKLADTRDKKENKE